MLWNRHLFRTILSAFHIQATPTGKILALLMPQDYPREVFGYVQAFYFKKGNEDVLSLSLNSFISCFYKSKIAQIRISF